jgi:hypothetical protein
MSEQKTVVITANDEGVLKKIKEMQQGRDGLNTVSLEEAKVINKFDDPPKVLKESTHFIRKHLNTIMEVAGHLHKVHSNQLFRLKYNSFQEYVNIEFDYTRGRGYQLLAAHDIAEYINSNIESDNPVLTTEPQCRELQKIKVYEDDVHQKIDNAKSNDERLKVVNAILAEHKKVTTKLIEDSVRNKLIELNKLPDDTAPADRYNKSIKAMCSNIDKMMDNIAKPESKLTNDDIDAIKDKVKERLQQTLDYIETLQPNAKP